MKRLLAVGLAVALIGLWPASLVHAQATGLKAVDQVVHEWDEKKLTAELAMKEIDAIIHDIPAAQRIGVLKEVDHVVHEWDEKKLTAEAAMKEIEKLVHGAGGAHASPTPAAATAPAAAPAPAKSAGSPAPAKTGSAGLGDTGATGTAVALGSVGLLVAFVVFARRTARSSR